MFMKNFLRRLKFYGIGFLIGLLFVFVFFQNRGCTWLPSNRVKNTIIGRVIVVNEADHARLKKLGISDNEIIHFLNDGDVAFGDSKKQGNPKVYSISREINGKEVELWFTLPKDAYVAEVRFPKGSIYSVKNSTTGSGRMISFPKVESLVYLDSNRRLSCQQEKLGLIAPATVVKRMKKTGYIDFSKTDWKASPHPIQYIWFTTRKGVKVQTATHWYQEHIQIEELETEKPLDCGDYESGNGKQK